MQGTHSDYHLKFNIADSWPLKKAIPQGKFQASFFWDEEGFFHPKVPYRCGMVPSGLEEVERPGWKMMILDFFGRMEKMATFSEVLERWNLGFFVIGVA